MYSEEQRGFLRSALLERARGDKRIRGAAITGSAAEEREDRWSDIDLAFGIAEDAELQDVLSGWTAHMYGEHGAVHHTDIGFGAWTYRVFLLPDTLQVDLAFVMEEEFRALGPTFRLVFGEAREPRQVGGPDVDGLIGMAWLHALHARSSLARQKLWQAEYMISGVRDHGLALACVRHGLPVAHGRGIDQLPAKVKAVWEESLIRTFEVTEMGRAFGVTVTGLVREVRCVDAGLADRLEGPLGELVGSAEVLAKTQIG